jgi:hypothetical protein
MPKTTLVTALLCASLVASGTLMLVAAQTAGQKPDREWQRDFPVRPSDLATAGESPYLILKPGYQLVLEGQESGTLVRLASA